MTADAAALPGPTPRPTMDIVAEALARRSVAVSTVVVAMASAAVAVAAGGLDQPFAVAAALCFGAVLGTLAVIDAHTRLIPNRIIQPALVVALLLLGAADLTGHTGSIWWGLAAAMATGGGLMTIAVLADGGLGMGDVRLGAYIGLHLGFVDPAHIPLVLVLGFGAASLCGLVLRRRSLPLGPFLVAGTLAGLVVA